MTTAETATWTYQLPAFDDRGAPCTLRQTKAGNFVPSITLNSQRGHHMANARIKKAIRAASSRLARYAAKIPQGQDHVTVWLLARFPDRRVRDEDNLAVILKAACDGLAPPKRGSYDQSKGRIIGAGEGAGVVPDDRPEHMTKHVRIEHDPSLPQPVFTVVVREGRHHSDAL